MCFYFGKNALSILAFSGFVEGLCGNKRSCVFFGAWLRLGHALFILAGYWKGE